MARRSAEHAAEEPRRQPRRAPQKPTVPVFFGPGEGPEGEAIAAVAAKPRATAATRQRAGSRSKSLVGRGRPGRPIVPRMPVRAEDGTLFRPRAKGSRGEQPAVQLGPLTSQLPLARTVAVLPYNDITASLGKLIRQYRSHLAAAERIWQQLETLEKGLRDLVVEDETLDGTGD